MKNILLSWIGRTDLRAPTEPGAVGAGPIAQALEAMEFDQVVLLCNYPKGEEKDYLTWLRKRCSTRVVARHVSLTSPTNYREIYEQAVEA